MKSFFANLNLARGIMLLAAIASVGLVVLGYQRSRELSELRLNLEQDVAKLAGQIQQLGRKHTQLTKNMRQEGLAGQADLESYIRKVANADKVEIGDLKLNPSSDPRTKGVIDKKYRIEPSNRELDFQRSRIANFLYKLESDSRRVKVTDITLEVAEKRVRPHETPEDKWTFKAEVTSRQRVEP
jgi:hypothetical protein